MAGLLSVNQLGQLPAVTISFNLPAGRRRSARRPTGSTRSGTARTCRRRSRTSFAGTAQVFQDAAANQGLLLLAAVVTIYVVLGILYESFIHPLTILTGLPAAAAGALLTLRIFGFDLSVIAIIGMLMLIGIVKKNAIMMIDFALVRQRAGASPHDAIREACLIRFRPIMMTTMAAIMGALADRARRRRRLRAAPAARRRGGRRADRLAGADAVHHAGDLSLHGGASRLGTRRLARRLCRPGGGKRLAETAVGSRPNSAGLAAGFRRLIAGSLICHAPAFLTRRIRSWRR